MASNRRRHHCRARGRQYESTEPHEIHEILEDSESTSGSQGAIGTLSSLQSDGSYRVSSEEEKKDSVSTTGSVSESEEETTQKKKHKKVTAVSPKQGKSLLLLYEFSTPVKKKSQSKVCLNLHFQPPNPSLRDVLSQEQLAKLGLIAYHLGQAMGM